MLPGLLSAAGGPQGILSSLKTAAADVLGKVASGRVNSGADFGRALAGAGSKLLGGVNIADKVEADVSNAVNNASRNLADNLLVQGNRPHQHLPIELNPPMAHGPQVPTVIGSTQSQLDTMAPVYKEVKYVAKKHKKSKDKKKKSKK